MAWLEASTVEVYWSMDEDNPAADGWVYKVEFSDGDIQSGPLKYSGDAIKPAIEEAIIIAGLDVGPEAFKLEDNEEFFASWMAPGVEFFHLLDDEEEPDDA